ncbi:hypothetical protein TRFO_07332 [Tritrichomonas foetus]|uniref:Wntless-like transmembrane domain-containing protein n=1 Tax=Tritrichomonas foetus TaxID=1144522 RepID=A0A1J4JXX9_9EUKA|nr:hypothetical protein TRFO_07332 [Tritrichomonas foetus]|eukprot:OHT02125.1 hypothetical protein TRFO_07332 [Tritrichomonas foetus]
MSKQGLVEIENENPIFQKETDMWIDSLTLKENIITFISFYGLFLIMLIIALNVKNPIIYSTIGFEYNAKMKRKLANIFKHDISPISGSNRFANFFLYFNRRDNQSSISTSIPFQVTIIKTYRDGVVNTTDYDYNVTCNIKKDYLDSDRYFIFQDHVITYNSLDIILKFPDSDNKTFKGVTLQSQTGGYDQTNFSIYYRIIFSLFQLFAFIGLLYKKFSGCISFYHLEQKIILLLIPILFLNNGPFYFLHILHPTALYQFFEDIADSIFVGYSFFSILMFFDFIKNKNKKFDISSIFPKLIFGSIITLSSLFFLVSKTESNLQSTPLLVHENIFLKMQSFFSLIFACVQICAALFIFFELGRTAQIVDILDQQKFMLYTYSSLIMILRFLLIHTSGIGIDLYQGNDSLEWSFKFIFDNFFVLIMVYSHWPYDIKNSHAFVDSMEAMSFSQAKQENGQSLIDDDFEDQIIEEGTKENDSKIVN